MSIMGEHRLDVIEEDIRKLKEFDEQTLKSQSIDYSIVVNLSRDVRELQAQIRQIQDTLSLLVRLTENIGGM